MSLFLHFIQKRKMEVKSSKILFNKIQFEKKKEVFYFDKLPLKLQLKILSNIFKIRDLKILRLVSKRWKDLIENHLGLLNRLTLDFSKMDLGNNISENMLKSAITNFERLSIKNSNHGFLEKYKIILRNFQLSHISLPNIDSLLAYKILKECEETLTSLELNSFRIIHHDEDKMLNLKNLKRLLISFQTNDSIFQYLKILQYVNKLEILEFQIEIITVEEIDIIQALVNANKHSLRTLKMYYLYPCIEMPQNFSFLRNISNLQTFVFFHIGNVYADMQNGSNIIENMCPTVENMKFVGVPIPFKILVNMNYIFPNLKSLELFNLKIVFEKPLNDLRSISSIHAEKDTSSILFYKNHQQKKLKWI